MRCLANENCHVCVFENYNFDHTQGRIVTERFPAAESEWKISTCLVIKMLTEQLSASRENLWKARSSVFHLASELEGN